MCNAGDRFSNSRLPELPRPAFGGFEIGVHRPDEVTSRARYPGPDRPYRNAADAGGFGVVASNDLGQNEGDPAVGSKRFEQQPAIDVPVETALRLDQGLHLQCELAAAYSAVNLCSTHPAGDRQQPSPDWGIAAEARQRPECAQESLLREVICTGSVDKIGAEPPHIGVGGLDEPGEGLSVAVAGVPREDREVVHHEQQRMRRSWSDLFRCPRELFADCRALQGMTCERVREGLSAGMDDELPAGAAPHVAEHLADCADCRRWQESAYAVTRRVRVRSALPDSDAPTRIVAAVRVDARRRRVRRYWLGFGSSVVVAGVLQLVATVPMLMIARSHTSGGGRLHTLGMVELTIGAGFFAGALVVLWRDRGTASPDVIRLDGATVRGTEGSRVSDVA